MRTVGVIGAGVMGAGVAQALTEHGHPTIVVDLDERILDAARLEIERNIRFTRMLAPRRGPATATSVPKFTTDYNELAGADFVIENITEKWDLKKEVYPLIDTVCPPHCVFAANTSAISVTRIAALTERPDKVLGMHFMNPVPLKPVVEVIQGWHTSQETLSTAADLLSDMEKEGIVVQDVPGFVTNRVLMPTINEAIHLIQDGVAEADDVDRIFRSCFGHKMGPLETADLIGLDTILYSVEVLYESFNDSKYRPAPLLKKMVAAGLHGRKSGRGFYRYS